MAATPRYFLLAVNVLLYFKSLSCSLDFEELQNVNYGIDIGNIPVLLKLEDSFDQVVLTSKYGQQYQCSFPNKATEEKKEKEEEKVAKETGIPELLKPMESSPCLIYTKDWWTYEFCYGKHISQYHVEDGKVSGTKMYLGLYESEFDWANDTKQEKKSNKNMLNRYHSQFYVNGSVCDLSGKPRRSEVRFLCQEGNGDHIIRIEEPESCVYVLTVQTTKICHHPYLKPPSPNKPLAIKCHPALGEQQYEEYHKQKAAERRAREIAEEKMKAMKMSLLQAESSKEDETDSDQSETKDDDGLGESAEEDSRSEGEGQLDAKQVMKDIEKAVVDSFQKELQEKGENTEGVPNETPEDSMVTMKRLASNDPGKIKDAIKAMLKEQRKLALRKQGKEAEEGASEGAKTKQEAPVGEASPPGEEGPPKETQPGEAATEDPNDTQAGVEQVQSKPESTTEETSSGENIKGDEDSDVLKEFEKGLDKIDLSDAQKQHLSKLKGNIESAMQAQFSDIVEEAQQELANEGMDPDVDKTRAFKKLATTLTKLLGRLEKAEKDLQDVDDHLKEAQSRSKKSAEDAKEAVQSKLEKLQEAQSRSRKSAQVAKEAVQAKLEKLQEEKDKTNSNSSPSKKEGMKVRVTRIKHAGQVKDSSKDTDIPEEQRKTLEKSVKDELLKAGLDTGGKIEVKIVTAGYFSDDDENVHVLSGEDTKSFNKMIVTILSGGGREAAKEMEKHNRMEENYNFVWDKKQKKKSSHP